MDNKYMPAFPIPPDGFPNGLTKREFGSFIVLGGLLANSDVAKVTSLAVRGAVDYVDAILEYLEKTENEKK